MEPYSAGSSPQPLLWRADVGETGDGPVRFDPDVLERAEAYARGARLLWLAGVLVELAVLAALVPLGPRLARRARGPAVVRGLQVLLVVLAAVWLARLPVAVAAQWWRRRYGLSDAGYLDRLVLNPWLELLGSVVLACVALAAGDAARAALRPPLVARRRAGARRRRRRVGAAPAARPRAEARPARRPGARRGDPGARRPARRAGRPRRGAPGERADDARQRGGLRARRHAHRRALGHAPRRPLHRRRDPLPRRARARARAGAPRLEGTRLAGAARAAARLDPVAGRRASKTRARCRRPCSSSSCSSSRCSR